MSFRSIKKKGKLRKSKLLEHQYHQILTIGSRTICGVEVQMQTKCFFGNVPSSLMAPGMATLRKYPPSLSPMSTLPKDGPLDRSFMHPSTLRAGFMSDVLRCSSILKIHLLNLHVICERQNTWSESLEVTITWKTCKKLRKNFRFKAILEFSTY